MQLEQLIEEGRRLARPCVYLEDTGEGTPAAVWHPQEPRDATSVDERLWLTLDLRQVPGLPEPAPDARFLHVFTNEKDGTTGRVAFAPALPTSGDILLYGLPANPLPPIDAVFARGSESVQAWLAQNQWSPEVRYNANFKDRALVEQYERVWQAECLLFHETDVYAVLGGWHVPGADDDWHERIDTPLVVWTLRDAEPWVEVFADGANRYSVLQRIT